MVGKNDKLDFWPEIPEMKTNGANITVQERIATPPETGHRHKYRTLQSALGREVASTLLNELGSQSLDVVAGPSGEPIWPDGFFGSISHCSARSKGPSLAPDTLLAAVALTSQRSLIGIDIEPLQSAHKAERVSSRIFQPTELATLESTEHESFHLIGFSAKETLYKALYPFCRFWFGFLSVSIRDASSSQLVVELLDERLIRIFGNEMMVVQWMEHSTATQRIILSFLCQPTSLAYP